MTKMRLHYFARIAALPAVIVLALSSLITAKMLVPALVIAFVVSAVLFVPLTKGIHNARISIWIWGIFGLFCAISAVITPLPEVSAAQLHRTALGAITGFLIFAVLPDGIARHASWSIAVLGSGFALITPPLVGLSSAPGMGLLINEPVFTQLSQRAQSFLTDTVNPNVLGGVIAYVLPVPLAALAFATNKRSRFAYGAVVLLMLGALWFSNSRGALAGFLLAGWCLLMVRWPRAGTVLACTGMLIAGGALLYFGTGILTPILTLGGAKEGPEYRLEIWSRAWYIIQDFTFTGIGMGSFERVVDLLYPLILGTSVPHAHNLYLQIAVDLGVPALIAWLCILYSVLRACVRVFRRTDRNDPRHSLAAGLLAAQVAMMAHGMVDAVLWGMVRTAPLVWMFWGLALALERMLNEHPDDFESKATAQTR